MIGGFCQFHGILCGKCQYCGANMVVNIPEGRYYRNIMLEEGQFFALIQYTVHSAEHVNMYVNSAIYKL